MPSPVFSATLPVKPSVTITSVVPAAMSWPSTKPWNCGAIWLARSTSAAWRRLSSPFCSSEPTFSRPMLGAVRPSTVRANTSPMIANSTRLRASQATLAPRSSITTSPRAEGPIAAIAGRSIPGSVFITITPNASRAPVLPAETTPDASPAATASTATRIEAPRTRRAAVGLMSLPITSLAWRTVQMPAARVYLASSGATRALIADQQEARLRMAFGGEVQALDDEVRRMVPAHRIDGERERLGQHPPRGSIEVRQGGIARGGWPVRVRREPCPSGFSGRQPPLPGHRNGRNGCIRGAAASIRRSSGIPPAPPPAAPGDCAACPAATARFFSLEQPWDNAPSFVIWKSGV